MHFSASILLVLLLLIPLFVWWQLRRKRAALTAPFVDSLRRLPGSRALLPHLGGVTLQTIGLVLLVIALAGPRWPDEGSRIPVETMSIAMVLDVSGSMAQPDFDWQDKRISRLEAARKTFRLFVAGGDGPGGVKFTGRKQDLLSLIAFAKRPQTQAPLTLNHHVILKLLEKEQPRSTDESTNIGDALAWALRGHSEAGKGRKIVVLLTDGEHNVPPPALKPRQAAQLAGNMDIPIYVIDAGRDSLDEGATEKERQNRARAKTILQEVARVSNGKYFQAGDSETLLKVSREIDRQERQRTLSFLYRRYHEGYLWFGLASLVCLLGFHFAKSTFWRRSP